MSLKAPTSQATNRVPQPTLEPASYPARIVRILDMGLQPQSYNGEAKAPARVLNVTYEFLDVFMQDAEGNDLEDKPRWISEDFPLNPLSSDLAKSTKRYNALDPEMKHDGDWAELINAPCTVTIAINQKGDKTYENISNVAAMRARDAAKAPELKNPSGLFLLDSPDMELFSKLPKWIQEKIQGNLEYAGSPLEAALKGGKPTPKAKEAPKKKEEPIVEDDSQDDVPW